MCTSPILFTGTILFTAPILFIFAPILFTAYYILFTRSEPVVAAPILFTHISSSQYSRFRGTNFFSPSKCALDKANYIEIEKSNLVLSSKLPILSIFTQTK